MNINAISNAQYRYHSPLPFSGKKAEKFSMEKDYPDVHAFYQTHKTFDPKIGSISCAPDEVQNFYGEITP